MYSYGGMEQKKMMHGGRVNYVHGGKAHKSVQDMERACKKTAGSNYHDES